MSLVAVFSVVKNRPSPYKHLSVLKRLLRIDPSGAALLTASFASLFLALEWGGVVLPWSSPRVWGCLLAFGLIVIVFVALQIVRKEQ